MRSYTKILFIVFFFALSLNIGTTQADTSGQERDFLLYGDFTGTGRDVSHATLRFVSDKAYFYVDNNYFNDLSREEENKFFVSLSALANEYDDRIYPILNEKFGKMTEPGLDGENRVYILLLPLTDDIGGYTNTADGFLKDRVSDNKTNELDLVYINVNYINNENIKGFLTHEMQHLISLQNKELKKGISDDVWLNELRSEYALEFLGYNTPFESSVLHTREFVFENFPNDPLAEWTNRSQDYAVVNMFAQYLAGAYGDGIFRKMVESDRIGIGSVNDALRESGYTDTFKDAFRNWQIANYVNDVKSFGNKFGYSNPDLNFRVLPTFADKVTEGESDESLYFQKDWQMAWLKYEGDTKFVTFKVESEDDLSLSYVLKKYDGTFSFGKVDINDKKGSFSVEGLGAEVESVTLLPFFSDKTNAFSEDDPKRSFILDISTDKNDLKEGGYKEISFYTPNGSLVRPAWSYDVYLVKDGFIRHISEREFSDKYKSEDVKVLQREGYNNYKKSDLVRVVDESKVYQLSSDGTRRWLDVSADDFLKSGRSFSGVFEISKDELQLYKEINSITKL